MKNIAISCMLLCTLFVGCNYTTTRINSDSDIEEARAVADKFYATLIKKDYTAADEFFLPEVFENDSNATAFLKDNGYNTGQLLSVEYKDGASKVETVNGDKNAQYELLYEATYANTKSEEKISLVYKNEAIKIEGYTITVPDEYIKQQLKEAKQSPADSTAK